MGKDKIFSPEKKDLSFLLAETFIKFNNSDTCDYMCGGGSSCGASCGRCGNCSCACSCSNYNTKEKKEFRIEEYIL
ncbi:hypothetical protein GYA25_00005 [Candidatus Woesearchaeota archaeon]|jgi:hypothetical protein|nr:hypothetical protein [Candidatus Woesearchaeota archaeon]